MEDVTRHSQAVALQALELREYPRYYARLFKNLTRTQKLELGGTGKRRLAVRTAPALQRSWRRLFGIDDARSNPLQTIYVRPMPEYVFDMLGVLGLNFSNIMQLGVDIEVHEPGFVVRPDTRYVYEIELQDIVHLSFDRGLIFVETRIDSLDGTHLLTHRDTLFLNKLSEADAAKLKARPADLAASKPYKGLSKEPRHLSASDAQVVKDVFVTEQAGVRYGALSGDLNPLHTRRLFSRLLGHPHAFVQGLFTTNLALKYLSTARPLRSFSMRFARPIYVGQDISFLAQDGRFEFQDQAENLLAFGSYALENRPLRTAVERSAA